MPTTRRCHWAYDLAAPAAIVLLPFLVFLRHNAYDISRGEVLICFGFFLAVGLLLGLLIRLGRTAGRLLILALLATYVLDMQVTDLTIPVALAAFLGFLALTWLVRKHVSCIATLFAAVMLLTTFFVPSGRMVLERTTDSRPAPARTDLPLVLHLVLDEHIGIEGIPAEFDPEGHIAVGLRDFLLQNGFEVYGRAYSRYFHTEESIANVFNFDASDVPSRHYAGPFKAGATLAENAWLDLLEMKGYCLHVVQTDYAPLLDATRNGDGPKCGSLVDYTLETIASVEHAPLAATEKARFIAGIYWRLSDVGAWGLRRYSNARLRLAKRGLLLPFWRDVYTRTSSLAARDMLDRLRKDLQQAGPGQAYVAHIMLPHGPYSYRQDGSLRPRGADWLLSLDRTKRPHNNDGASRAASYEQYLEQVQMTRRELSQLFTVLKEIGQWDNAIVVLHGDHGSRITIEWPTAANRERLSETDLIDGFSALFAVKRPGHPARYDRRELPLDHLAKRILRDDQAPGDSTLEDRPCVLLDDQRDHMVSIDMPAFGRELPAPPR